MFIRILVVMLCLTQAAWADSIDDEIQAAEAARNAELMQRNTSLHPQVQKGDEPAAPIALKLFRGRSDGWWQAIVVMSNGMQVSVNNDFSAIYGKWRVVNTRGNSLFVQEGDQASTRRQLFVDMQGENGISANQPAHLPAPPIP